MGIGIDIVDLRRLTDKLRIITKVLTAKELEIFNARKDQFAFFGGRFAAKEAFLKAMGKGLGEINFLDIEILPSEKGRPVLRYQNQDFEVSISHDGDYAIAVVML
jgi:holo-[acyl-carrier protein] synthase